MDSILQGQLDRIEAVLSSLIDSISSYNPSIPAAQNLLTADDELQRGLKQLHTHQKNHAWIQEIRRIIDRQNTQITSTLQLLADTRTELLAIPTSLPPKDRRKADTGELLDFAKRISRSTAPPAFKPAALPAVAAAEGAGIDGRGSKEGIGLDALVEEEKRWLDPFTGVQFTPWPSEEIIRGSALARMQAGEALGAEALDANGAVERQADNNMMQIVASESMQPEGAVRTGGMAAAVKKEEKPKVFGGLDLYDPDADE